MVDRAVQSMMVLMASKIRSIAGALSETEIDSFLDALLRAKRVYIMGAGRSGLVAKAFAMRLMHLGLLSYVVGETITPAMNPEDLLVVFSGSGATKTVADIAETVKGIGGKVFLISYNRDSRIGKIADGVVVIPSQREKDADASLEFEIRQMMGDHKSFAPLGTLFETTAMVFADAVISRLMEIMKCDVEDLRCRHANIE